MKRRPKVVPEYKQRMQRRQRLAFDRVLWGEWRITRFGGRNDGRQFDFTQGGLIK